MILKMVVITTTMVMLKGNCVRCEVTTDMILRIHVRPFLRNVRRYQTTNTKHQTPNTKEGTQLYVTT